MFNLSPIKEQQRYRILDSGGSLLDLLSSLSTDPPATGLKRLIVATLWPQSNTGYTHFLSTNGPPYLHTAPHCYLIIACG